VNVLKHDGTNGGCLGLFRGSAGLGLGFVSLHGWPGVLGSFRRTGGPGSWVRFVARVAGVLGSFRRAAEGMNGGLFFDCCGIM
jgi:hypothetical protein